MDDADQTNPFAPMPASVSPKCRRLIGFLREFAINADQIARARNFAGNNDLVFAQTAGKREFSRLERGENHALVDDVFGGAAEVAVGVFLHLLHDELLIERTAVHADADGLAVVDGDFADGGELLVAARAFADVAGIDAIFVESLGAFGILCEQHVAVVMKIANQRSVTAGIEDALFDFRDGGGGFGDIHGDANDFGASLREFEVLVYGASDVGGIGIGHRLHDDRSAAADLNLADFDADRVMAF